MEAILSYIQPLFDWLLQATLIGSVVICLILLIQKTLGGKLGPRWCHALWLILLIRMVLPWAPSSRISLFNLIPSWDRQIQPQKLSETTRQQEVFQSSQTPDFTEATQTDRSESVVAIQKQATPKPWTLVDMQKESKNKLASLRRALPIIWLAGAVVIGAYLLMSDFALWRIVKRDSPLIKQTMLELFEECKAQMGVQSLVAIVPSSQIRSPGLFGFVRPRLLLPQEMLDTATREEMRYVFLHELAHLKRHDIYLGWLTSLLQVLHWFNPLIWFAFYQMRTDRELACDAMVLARTEREESEEYGQVIINLVRRFSRSRRLPAMAGIVENRSQLKRRIKMIADYKKTSRTRWAGAMLLFAVLACVVLTNAYVAKADFTFGTPTNLGPTVNSSARDSRPSISADGLELYFGSNRSGGSGNLDIWVTTREPGRPWGPPVNLGPTVNTSALEACPSVSADGLSLFFGSRERAGGAGNDDVWVTTRDTKDDPWGVPVNLGPTVNSSSAECCPSISSDGLSLFFRSNAHGGFGRQDLWVTTRATSDDDWGPPVNLGPTVNSASNDYDPSISSDGLTLFFHSRRSGGYGDDLYVTMRATISDPWSMPVNLGPTINSSSDDGAPSISDDGSTLFFASSRPGGVGRDDIWQVSLEPIVDLNSDGIVDSADICIIIDGWGTDEPLCDVGPMPWGDGIVDVQDLIVLAEHLTIKEDDPNEPNLP